MNKLLKAKLPNLELLKFGGKFLEWVPLWNSFQLLVGDCGNLI